MEALLTGGSGFVGINIAEALLEKGVNVTVYSRRKIPEQAIKELSGLPGKLKWAKGDVLDEARISEVLEENGIEAVVHAAAITPGLEREKEQMPQIVRVNVLGTLNVLEAARKHSVSKFIYVSSVAVYGNASQKHDPVYEDVEKNPHNTYELSKYATENLVKRYRELHKMKIAALRLGDVFGAWEYMTAVRDTLSAPYQCLKAAMLGQKIILPKEANTGWVYGKDCGLAVSALLGADQLNHFVYNCGSIYRWSIRQFCERLKEHYPNFDYSMGDFETATIRFHAVEDNGMFDMSRIEADTGFVPVFDLDRCAQHYMAWADKYPELTLQEPER